MGVSRTQVVKFIRKGDKGETGNGISSVTEYYLASALSSGVTVSTAGWTTDTQTITEVKKYLWNYEVITYSNGAKTTTKPVIIGTYGEKGDKGDTGDQGDKGERGAVLRGPQAWSDCATGYAFQAGGVGEKWQDVVIYGDNYYSCVKSHTKTASNYPGSTTAINNGYWQLGDKIELVATKILLATYALVKNLGVEAIDMKDANGNILFQAKDGAVTCKTGTFENVTVQGTLKGVTGTFKSLNCVNDSGTVVGGISFDSSGRLWFSGDMYHQGYDSSIGRGYRFYMSDVWCRGQFGASERNVLVVKGSYGYYYTKGMSYSGTYVAFTKKTSSNNIGYYVLPMYGTSGDYTGFPVDVLVFSINSRTVYNYELSMNNSQRVLVVNANDDEGNVNIFSNGNLVKWEGGAMAEVIKLANVMRPTPDSSLLGCGLKVGAFRDNDW
jgi:hypothetical protein